MLTFSWPLCSAPGPIDSLARFDGSSVEAANWLRSQCPFVSFARLCECMCVTSDRHASRARLTTPGSFISNGVAARLGPASENAASLHNNIHYAGRRASPRVPFWGPNYHHPTETPTGRPTWLAYLVSLLHDSRFLSRSFLPRAPFKISIAALANEAHD